MDYRQIFSDPEMVTEFLDRFSELDGGASGGLESSGGLEANRPAKDAAEKAVRTIQENTGEHIDAGLEAIILNFGRPAYFVQEETFNTYGTPSSSEMVDAKVNAARQVIESAIPSVGRINLRNNRAPWIGTGWIVAPNVLVTNRHVARAFTERDGDAFVFVETGDGRQTKAYLDTFREHRNPRESVFRLRKVLWIEPERREHPDVAFLEIDEKSEEDEKQPRPIELMEATEYERFPVQSWATVIGYPAYSIYNDAQDQQRIFEGVFNVKRMQPGLVTAKQKDGVVKHDATTLGGNSGSVIVDLDSGKAIALHYGGIEGETNEAVAAPVVAQLLGEKIGSA